MTLAVLGGGVASNGSKSQWWATASVERWDGSRWESQAADAGVDGRALDWCLSLRAYCGYGFGQPKAFTLSIAELGQCTVAIGAGSGEWRWSPSSESGPEPSCPFLDGSSFADRAR